ncbi:hypothetical protein [Undibacterium sp. Tian12W]|uniref:hypothetical protein n=1 Tax=Undibacterium sp. Tian12W TaxID=3413054 RepID=UPI003BF441FC
MKELVARIFPKAASAWGRIGYESDSVSIWRNELRVCCADLFDIYFQFGLSPDYLSRSELNSLLDVAENPGMAANILLAANLTIRASGRSKAADYIDRLRDLQDELTSAKAIGLLTALFEIGDVILGPKDESQGFFSLQNSWRLSFLVNHLFKYIPVDGRHLQLRQLVSNGKAIGLSVATVDRIRRNIEKPEDDSVFSVINQQLFNDLRSIVHDRLNRMPSLDFLKLREMSTVIFIWLAWGYQNDVQTKMVPLFTADALLPQTLEKFLQVGRAQVMGDHGVKRTLRMNPNNISEIIDIEAIAPKIHSMLNNSDLTPDQKYAGEDYLRNLDRIRNGENVDRFGD